MTFIDNYIIEKDREAAMAKAFFCIEYRGKCYDEKGNTPEEAVEWFEADMDDKLAEDGEYGPWSADIVITGINEDGNEIYRREHTARGYVEKDTYDEGRFDYYASR